MKGIKKYKAQSLLETVLVFVGVVGLAIGAMGLFAQLNRRQLGRLKDFKDTRLVVLNNLFSLDTGCSSPYLPCPPTSPKYYLRMHEKKKDLGDIESLPDFSGTFAQEKRIVEAQLKMKEFDSILNFVLHYKVNQMKKLKDRMGNPYSCSTCDPRQTSQGYIYCGYYFCTYKDEIHNLADEAINDVWLAYNNLYYEWWWNKGVIYIFDDILEHPTQFGPYDLPHCFPYSSSYCPIQQNDGTYRCRQVDTNNNCYVTAQDGNYVMVTCQPGFCDENGEIIPNCNEERLPKPEQLNVEKEKECIEYNKLYCNLEQAIRNNRCNLYKTRLTLDDPNSDSDARYNIEYMMWKVPSSQVGGIKGLVSNSDLGNTGSLNYIRDNISNPNWCGGWWGRYYCNWWNHSLARILIDELVDFVGENGNCIISNELARSIEEVYQKIVTVFNKVFRIIPYLKIRDNYELGETDKQYLQDALDTCKNWSQIPYFYNEEYMINPQTQERIDYARDIVNELIQELESCLGAWDDFEQCSDENSAECQEAEMDRVYNLGAAYLDIKALYKITAINRRIPNALPK